MKSFSIRVAGEEGKVSGIIGSRLKYARSQELGWEGDVTIKVTNQMKKFFYAKWKETGLDMWFYSFLSKTVTPHLKIPAHYYLRNTVKDNQAGALRIFKKQILEGIE